MAVRVFDVDIDVPSKTDKSIFGVRSMIEVDGNIQPHPSGYYVDDVPTDPLTGLCAFDVSYGDAQGWQKIDLLSNTSYDMFSSKEEVLRLMDMTPQWDLLLDKDILKRLPHITNHYDILERVRPSSIEDLADVLALIRPAKINLLDKYVANPEKIRKKLYLRSNKHYFKKSHAISYAVMIVCVLNKITENRIIF